MFAACAGVIMRGPGGHSHARPRTINAMPNTWETVASFAEMYLKPSRHLCAFKEETEERAPEAGRDQLEDGYEDHHARHSREQELHALLAQRRREKRPHNL
jgi:hypothetical protein